MRASSERSRTASATHPNTIIDGELFSSHPDAAFYIGEVAACGTVYSSDLHKGSGVLRATVYIDEKKFLHPDTRNAEGVESDADDGRSIAIAMAQVSSDAKQVLGRVVATERLILKRNENDPLPLEYDFPEVFSNAPAPTGSAEISRLIARHPNPFTQFRISMGIIRAGFRWLDLHRPDVPAYAMIEPGFVRMLQQIELPYQKLTPFKKIGRYANTRNAVIKVDASAALAKTRPDLHHLGTPDMAEFFRQQDAHDGYGYFDASLQRPVK